MSRRDTKSRLHDVTNKMSRRDDCSDRKERCEQGIPKQNQIPQNSLGAIFTHLATTCLILLHFKISATNLLIKDKNY